MLVMVAAASRQEEEPAPCLLVEEVLPFGGVRIVQLRSEDEPAIGTPMVGLFGDVVRADQGLDPLDELIDQDVVVGLNKDTDLMKRHAVIVASVSKRKRWRWRRVR